MSFYENRCMRCHRRLSNPKSIERKLGPVCFRKLKSRGWVQMALGAEINIEGGEVSKEVIELLTKEEENGNKG